MIDKSRIGISLIEQLDSTTVESQLQSLDKPILIMHGSLDKRSPIEQLEMVREHVKSPRIEITSFQDGEHGLHQNNHRKPMHFHIDQFIEKYV